MTEEDKISRRYRELQREEPPRHLDDAILAASRRAVHTHPAPLVVPSGRQRWYFPLAAAAIIVLAVGVTMHMQLQQPADEMFSTNAVTAPAGAREADSAPAANEAAPAAKPAAPARAPSSSARGFELRDQASSEQSARREMPSPSEAPPRLDLPAPPELQKSLEVAATPPAASQDALRMQQSAGALFSRVEPAPQASPAPPAAAARPSPAPQPKAAAGRVQATIAEKADSAPKLAASSVQSPEQWLQGIADLRAQSYHDEADRQLAEFRKRYPDYRIAEPMLRKVERPR